MFPRYGIGIGNPFQQFGAINPFQQPGMGGFSAWPAFGGVNPLTPQAAGYGFSPYAGMQTPGVGAINPLIASQLGVGGTPIHPAVAAHLAQTALLPYLAQSLVGVGESNPLAQVLANPGVAGDPLVSALVAQQAQPWGGQQLPIRPLIGSQHFSPFQSGIPAGFSPFPGQVPDPYTALAQASLLAQLAATGHPQAFRGYVGSPFVGQTFPFAQTGTPFNF